MQPDPHSLVQLDSVSKHFAAGPAHLFGPPQQNIVAVDDVSLNLRPGETLGLVGESGSGKSTVGRLALCLLEPTGGEIWFNQQNLGQLSASELKRARKQFQLVFQDPFGSLNPRMSVGDIVREPLDIFRSPNLFADRNSRVRELLALVGLRPEAANRFPHEFSGGQRQRIAIARAIALGPKFVVCDEPVSALDVSVQAQILNLLMDLQEKLNLTYLFISHDLRVVQRVSSRTAVMYLGCIVEVGDTEDLFRRPLHPYTHALLSAVPRINVARRQTAAAIVAGEIPSVLNPPSGCRFHTRCPFATDRCSNERPLMRELAGGRQVACHYAGELLMNAALRIQE